ncbi:HIT family protein [Candidatus Woesearchaeota archaeon]|jgi:histidine triad (HIT) family protein|nr:HIT family protein [Candidatus Woesearchaeota archaeon]MBT5272405.1 HIT family protein [Candidatus Woesearchaeota archaeon]MBT6041253.1 HIT family protein [Candidatus Woesearchaeota archaeon]MBT6336677.1 HIT family protein [Candidatus Woesearchaeota archaeon]MBT7927567.1 HIT family protein [Candidatus Woesearchaeota archaeon]
MTDCIFCKIANKEIPSNIVYEDDRFLAFLDIAPANKGHVLVIPKEHHEVYIDLPDEVLKELSLVTKKVCLAMSKSLKNCGYNIFMNNKETAGQIVPHAHFHIIPRFNDDGIKFSYEHKTYSDGEAEQFKEKISKEI